MHWLAIVALVSLCIIVLLLIVFGSVGFLTVATTNYSLTNAHAPQLEPLVPASQPLRFGTYNLAQGLHEPDWSVRRNAVCKNITEAQLDLLAIQHVHELQLQDITDDLPGWSSVAFFCKGCHESTLVMYNHQRLDLVRSGVGRQRPHGCGWLELQVQNHSGRFYFATLCPAAFLSSAIATTIFNILPAAKPFVLACSCPAKWSHDMAEKLHQRGLVANVLRSNEPPFFSDQDDVFLTSFPAARFPKPCEVRPGYYLPDGNQPAARHALVVTELVW